MVSSPEIAAARLAARNAAVADTRHALGVWLRSPRQLAPWFGLSAVIAGILLVATYLVSVSVTPHETTAGLIAADPSSRLSDFAFILGRNLTVLLLHLMVCFATYLVRRSLPIQAGEMSGLQRLIHRHASGPAIVVVIGLTIFSMVQQAVTLGHALADLSLRGMSQADILVRLLPHAVPELIAVFLPIAAVIWLETRNRNRDLLAAVAACTAIAVPVIVASAFVEVVVASHFF